MSRGRSSEALRDYRASQRPPPTYVPPRPSGSPRPLAPSAAGFLGLVWAAPATAGPCWGGSWDTVSPRRSFGTGLVTGRVMGRSQRAVVIAGPGRVYSASTATTRPIANGAQEAERAAARDPEIAAKLGELDAPDGTTR